MNIHGFILFILSICLHIKTGNNQTLNYFILLMVFVLLLSGQTFLIPAWWASEQKYEEKRSANTTLKPTTTTIITITTTTRNVSNHSSTKLPPCDEDQLMVYLAEIQAINPESIINLSTLDDLDVLCKFVNDTLTNKQSQLMCFFLFLLAKFRIV